MPFAFFPPWWIKIQMYGATFVKITEHHLILIPCVEIWPLAWISAALKQDKNKKAWNPLKTYPMANYSFMKLYLGHKSWQYDPCVSWRNLVTFSQVVTSFNLSTRRKYSFKNVAIASEKEKSWRPPWSWSKASYCVCSFQPLYTFDPQMTK